jgi:myosin heavy subunit
MTDAQIESQRSKRQVSNMSDAQIESQRSKRQVRNMSDEQVTQHRQRNQTENMSDERVAQHRAQNQTENMSDERVAQHRAQNQTENMSGERVAQHRAQNQTENMSDERVAQHRAQNQTENMSDERVAQHRDQNQTENMSGERVAQHRALNQTENMSNVRAEIRRIQNRDQGAPERNRRQVHDAQRRLGKKKVAQEWDYSNPCPHCNALYLIQDKSRNKCCKNGAWFGDQSPFPKLKKMPPQLEFLSTQMGNHFSKKSAAYNGLFSLVSTGVDNGRDNVGYEARNGMDSAVTLNGRTYHRLICHNCIQYYTFISLIKRLFICN